MSLKDYKNKRELEPTSEPNGISKDSDLPKEDDELIFIVQKHHASHLHYDFRLESEGVLKSWAVPKGPTLDPAIKHLAVLVEDHPLKYKDFIGIIPEGNYGAGSVEIWDKGTYHALETYNRQDTTKKVKEGFAKGHITIILKGNRLNGEFAFVRLKKGKINNWLMIKKNDQFAIRGWDINAVDLSPDLKKTKF